MKRYLIGTAFFITIVILLLIRHILSPPESVELTLYRNGDTAFRVMITLSINESINSVIQKLSETENEYAIEEKGSVTTIYYKHSYPEMSNIEIIFINDKLNQVIVGGSNGRGVILPRDFYD